MPRTCMKVNISRLKRLDVLLALANRGRTGRDDENTQHRPVLRDGLSRCRSSELCTTLIANFRASRVSSIHLYLQMRCMCLICCSLAGVIASWAVQEETVAVARASQPASWALQPSNICVDIETNLPCAGRMQSLHGFQISPSRATRQ